MAGPESSGVPTGTTAIISSLITSTSLPVNIYLMEITSKIIPPATANEFTEISIERRGDGNNMYHLSPLLLGHSLAQ